MRKNAISHDNVKSFEVFLKRMRKYRAKKNICDEDYIVGFCSKTIMFKVKTKDIKITWFEKH